VFGNPLYREIIGRREHPEVGIVAICAHEFGHIVQYKHGIDRVLIVNNSVKRLELHADFLAGYFAGRRKLEMPDFPAAVFALTQYSFGDSNYGDPEHHGTSDERGAAVVAGFDSAHRMRESFATAVETGIRYVQQVPL
jgi:predicted metalloprotease